jgi:ATP-binding cassette subfamily B protein
LYVFQPRRAHAPWLFFRFNPKTHLKFPEDGGVSKMTSNTPSLKSTYFDFRTAIAENRLKGLWQVMSGFHWSYGGAVLALSVSALAKTATFLLLRYFADLVSNNAAPIAGDFSRTFIYIAMGFVCFASIEGYFAYLSGRLAAYTAESIARRLRNFLFDHIQRLTFSYHSKTPTGDLIERVTSDVDALRRFFSEQAIGVGRIVLLFVINFIAILAINWKLGLASVIVIPFILLASLWFFKRVTERYEKYQEQEAALSTTLQENLTGVRVVKAFARQEYEKGKFEKDNWEKYIRGKALLLMHSLFWPLSDIVLGFQMLGGFIFAATMAIHGEISVGTYLAYVGLVVWLIWPIRNLGRLIVQTSTGMVSYGRLLEIIKQEREDLHAGKLHPTQPVKGQIIFDKVCFHYVDGESAVLKDISFVIQPGQSIALIGSTGSGKTSLVNLLPRFHEYTRGRILLDGVELTDYSREYLRKQIGIVEQEPFLFSRSIRENISYGVGRKVTDEEIIRATKAAAVHEVISGFPDGYDTIVGEKGVTLSGGQKQRVTIARTLLKNPRILILDDSTSSVDMNTEAEIRQALTELMEHRTTFIIAHRIQSVMNADLILVLDKGEIIQTGKHEQLILNPQGIYRKIFDIQTRVEDELEDEIFAVS